MASSIWIFRGSPAAPSFGAAPDRPKLSAETQKGRDHFADQVRGMTRCSLCHQADGVGFPVTLPIKNVPANIAELRAVKTPNVETATAEGDQFAALAIDKNGSQPKLYDLTTPPPVLRTFEKGQVTFHAGSTWQHTDMLKPYSEQELQLILQFLQAVAKP